MDLGIIIVNWNVRDLLAACLDSVYAELAGSAAQLSGTVIVVDNGSTDGSVEMLHTQFPRTRLIQAPNPGMGGGNNLGLRALRSDFDPFACLILNPDTVVHPGALAVLVEFLRTHPRAGVAAPKLLNPDGTLQHAGFRFPGLVQNAFDLLPLPGRLRRLADSPLNGRYPAARYRGSPFPVDHTLGAAFAVRGQAMTQSGLFDETFDMYCEEIDWQWRLGLAGWERWVVPAAEIVHYGGQSTSQARAQSLAKLWTSRRQLHQRYHGPAFNFFLGLLVQTTLSARLRAAGSDEMKQALNEIIDVWRKPVSKTSIPKYR